MAWPSVEATLRFLLPLALGAALDRLLVIKDKREASARAKRVISREIAVAVHALEAMITVEASEENESLPQSWGSTGGLSGAAEQIERECPRDALVANICLVDGLDPTGLDEVMGFYDSVRGSAYYLRQVEGANGNIRASLIPDVLHFLVERGRTAMGHLA